MLKKLSNNTIESFVVTLNKEDSVLKTLRMPHALRQAVKVNLNTLLDRAKVFEEERKELVDSYVEKGWATANNDGSISVGKEHIAEVNKELVELANVENELNIETVKKDIIDNVLENNSLTLGEEEVFLFFADENEDKKNNT